jgi:hypothetical protein
MSKKTIKLILLHFLSEYQNVSLKIGYPCVLNNCLLKRLFNHGCVRVCITTISYGFGG